MARVKGKWVGKVEITLDIDEPGFTAEDAKSQLDSFASELRFYLETNSAKGTKVNVKKYISEAHDADLDEPIEWTKEEQQ